MSCAPHCGQALRRPNLTLGLLHAQDQYPPVDDADKVSARPDFAAFAWGRIDTRSGYYEQYLLQQYGGRQFSEFRPWIEYVLPAYYREPVPAPES